MNEPVRILGYTSQSDQKIESVNRLKEIEEIVLRLIDELEANPDTDKRCVAETRTCLQTAFMWASRSIFKPQRIKLSTDEK